MISVIILSSLQIPENFSRGEKSKSQLAQLGKFDLENLWLLINLQSQVQFNYQLEFFN